MPRLPRPVRTVLLSAVLLPLPLLPGAAAPLSPVPVPPGVPVPHMRLLKSTPAADAVLPASPDAIRLWFSEAVDPKGSTVTVKGADGAVVALAPLSRAGDKDAPLVAPLGKPVGAGAYTVTWKGMSRDGHVVNGTFTFKVRSTP